MNNTQKFIDMIREIAGSEHQSDMMLATVVSVEADHTCTIKPVHAEEVELKSVRLQVLKGNDYGLLLKPAEGSQVIYQRLGKGDQYCVVHTQELESFSLKIGDKSLVADNSGFHFNEGDNGGIVLSQVVADEIDVIKQDLNALKQVFLEWIPNVPESGTLNDGGLTLKNIIETWASDSLTSVIKEDYENSIITH